MLPDQLKPLAAVRQSTRIPNRFRCRAEIIDHRPSFLEDFCRPFCSMCNESCPPRPEPRCPSCNLELDRNAQYIYMFSVLLDDGRDQLEVVLHGPDAEAFLDIPACNLYKDVTQRERLRMKLLGLVGTRIECQVESYRAFHEAKRFRLIA
ncbi:hypothetical protein M427DRAFT_448051 [Gonapodya prolifera JEL478]|uniref:Replication factor A C-terminal domain-containing protein n=1 Tax=Gonapodya prolifera (strain JEL478) TaxID=1344416 RepID=A0A139ASA8_GONPJ|nr:hypothetical protein M427DRAFT_448051 [Gonapodya prolifera JEL478]|eukprot:KXS19355.1 hypothetical protein M427DRAFT_448051 [Gonapodya prolifera JEL478]